jgi:REP element-mobilizing transposase RayT
MRPDKVFPKVVARADSVAEKCAEDYLRSEPASPPLHPSQGWNYGSEGAYFITVCARNQLCVFGEVSQDRVRLSPLGEVVRMIWMQTAVIRRHVVLHEFVVMPNHFHGIVFLNRTACRVERATPWVAPTSSALRHSPTSRLVRKVVRSVPSSASSNLLSQKVGENREASYRTLSGSAAITTTLFVANGSLTAFGSTSSTTRLAGDETSSIRTIWRRGDALIAL